MEEVYSVFVDGRHLKTGDLKSVVKAAYSDSLGGLPLFFEHSTGRQRDFALEGSLEEVLMRVCPPPSAQTGPGRPRLGVVSTEVTLLPRHWEWLAEQPGKASATLRRLVENAMTSEKSDPKRRFAALDGILGVVAGNLPGYEEVSRELYAGHKEKVLEFLVDWPSDITNFVSRWMNAIPFGFYNDE